MNNPETSAKKKFSILTKLLNNKEYSSIPPLLENEQIISESKQKSDLLNKHFASKSSVPNADDDVPFLPHNPIFPLYAQLIHLLWRYPK